ncbi:leucine-rich repeat domain-containing protein [Flavobacterium psychrophilum]|uniref:leucine-rich repeat domain-containing protein n=1 Tax=Flavobacterium psychrophilum TaxID=96345 RepID=UPI000A3D2722|nr:leucine-rich repeat domain-containing protein [Flavobacterium psychrophilum]EKT4550057.1 leucine-rich repeat domain-containing protein [Flavobacterium psychrophilum]ELI6453896.1 leucine-rich repeat domain-containing protein [Flavobacterium psychrophilum]ELY2017177.1 leucine-rich repeat domain-containing protein [Flavobacterium psychrophilum]MCB6230867.1 leucine-rich repeat protein [Flavobacterium psychrophilum]MEB3378881.1 leucine-rich repeat domain-containing protein [Flavobacterium psychr
MKKLLFFILMPFLGIAQNFTANRINYTITSSTTPLTAKVARNDGFTGVAEIPEIVVYNSENYAVTAIGDGAFNGTSLTSVTIPNSITSIGNSAFAGCSGLASATIPNSVNSIDDFAFTRCTSLRSVTIPNSVTSMGDYAFRKCSSLTTVNCHITIPLVINANAFSNVTQSNCALNVPPGTEAAYKAAAVWKDFSPISGGFLSSNSFAIESNLKIYPNPVSEILNIALQEGLQLEKVNFYNTLGQLIKTTNHSEINVSSFAKGNYFVEIMTNQGKATKSVIIQ